MDTIKFENKSSVKMIAHRGLSGLERENTCPAFVAAGVKSYYGIETDVHVTLDGRYIIIHDDNLKRVGGGLEMVVEQSLFDDLRAIRLTDRDGVTKRADIFLPTLEEYLSICKKYGKVAVLELKNEMSEQHVIGIANVVREMEMFGQTTFISFARGNLVALRAAYPDADVQWLLGSISDDKLELLISSGMDADVAGSALTKEFIDAMHAAGRVVNAWTVDSLETAAHLRDIGVDMITTNILE